MHINRQSIDDHHYRIVGEIQGRDPVVLMDNVHNSQIKRRLREVRSMYELFRVTKRPASLRNFKIIQTGPTKARLTAERILVTGPSEEDFEVTEIPLVYEGELYAVRLARSVAEYVTGVCATSNSLIAEFENRGVTSKYEEGDDCGSDAKSQVDAMPQFEAKPQVEAYKSMKLTQQQYDDLGGDPPQADAEPQADQFVMMIPGITQQEFLEIKAFIKDKFDKPKAKPKPALKSSCYSIDEASLELLLVNVKPEDHMKIRTLIDTYLEAK